MTSGRDFVTRLNEGENMKNFLRMAVVVLLAAIFLGGCLWTHGGGMGGHGSYHQSN